MKTGVEFIAEERRRHIEQEGWTLDQDSKYTDGELAAAASVYADMANYHGEFDLMGETGKAKVLIPRDFKWPFEKKWLKLTPDDRVRELQKAGSLIAAEIDRLNGVEPSFGQDVYEADRREFWVSIFKNELDKGYPAKLASKTADEATGEWSERFGKIKQ